MNKNTNIVTKFISILMILITGYLFLVSLFSTVYVSEQENIYYVKDYAIVNIVVLAAFLTFIFLLRNKVKTLLDGNEKKMVCFNTIVLAIFLVYFVMSTRLYPLYDQAKVLTTVKQMCVYDYSTFLPGGYQEKANVLWGYTLFVFALTKILGKISIAGIQLVNVVCVVLSNYIVYKIVANFSSKKVAALSHLALCLYAPMWFYTVFIYGNIPSYTFAVISIYFICEMRKRLINVESYENNIVSKKDFFISKRASRALVVFGFALLAAISMSISIILKMNSLIFMIAIVLVLGYYLVMDAKAGNFIAIFLMLLIYVMSSKALRIGIDNMVKMDLQGMPRTSHIAMALQENSDKGPGWFNGYVDSLYIDSNYSQEIANDRAKDNIKESINGFKSNPANFISFVSRKVVSQWNEPTYGSLYILYGRDSIGETPGWFKELSVPTSGLNKAVREILNLVQLIVLFGTLLYFIMSFRNATMDNLTFSVVVLGGFFFHILWEAKSQYIFVYFILLIPYAVSGYTGVVGELNSGVKVCKPIRNTGIVLAALSLMIALVPPMSVPGKIFKPSWKTEEYLNVTNSEFNNYGPAGILDKDYANALNMPHYRKLGDRYFIALANDEEFILSPISESSTDENDRTVDSNAILKFSRIDSPSIEDSALIFQADEDRCFIRFQKNQKVMDVENGIIEAGSRVKMWDFNADDGQKFTLEKTSENQYKMTCGGFALKMTESGELVLTNIDDKDALIVSLRKAK